MPGFAELSSSEEGKLFLENIDRLFRDNPQANIEMVKRAVVIFKTSRNEDLKKAVHTITVEMIAINRARNKNEPYDYSKLNACTTVLNNLLNKSPYIEMKDARQIDESIMWGMDILGKASILFVLYAAAPLILATVGTLILNPLSLALIIGIMVLGVVGCVVGLAFSYLSHHEMETRCNPIPKEGDLFLSNVHGFFNRNRFLVDDINPAKTEINTNFECC